VDASFSNQAFHLVTWLWCTFYWMANSARVLSTKDCRLCYFRLEDRQVVAVASIVHVRSCFYGACPPVGYEFHVSGCSGFQMQLCQPHLAKHLLVDHPPLLMHEYCAEQVEHRIQFSASIFANAGSFLLALSKISRACNSGA